MPSTLKPIVVSGFNQAGLSDSLFSGVKNSLYKLVGYDLHSNPGLLTVRQKLVKNSGRVVGELCVKAIGGIGSNGYSYWFSAESGNIWQCTDLEEWSLVYTIVANSGSSTIMNAFIHNGYLYIVTEKRLHRISTSKVSSGDWASNITLNWKNLDQDQADIGGTGQVVTAPTSYDETATKRQTITSLGMSIVKISVNVAVKGTGDLTLTVHDVDNNSILTGTILNASLVVGWNDVALSTGTGTIIPGQTYHVHITSTVADTTIVSAVASDQEGANLRLFGTGNTYAHPSLEVYGVTYLANNNVLHSLDENGIFNYSVLDVPVEYSITSLERDGISLLIGTAYGTNNGLDVPKARLFNWNTFSGSWTSDAEINESAIHVFMKIDNLILVQAGIHGNIYVWNGLLQLYGKIPGDYSGSNVGRILQHSLAYVDGNILFGMSNISGNPVDQGVYHFGKNSHNYSNIMDLSYPVSPRDSAGDFILTGLSIGAMLIVGGRLMVSWKSSTSAGVDKQSLTEKVDKAYFETLVLSGRRDAFYTYSEFNVTYFSMPDGTSIKIKTKKNYETDWKNATIQLQTARHFVTTKNVALEATSIQVRVEAISSGNDAPSIESLLIYLRGSG